MGLTGTSHINHRDKTFRFTEQQKRSYTPMHVRVKRTVARRMKGIKRLAQHKNKKVINKNIATFGKEKISISQE